MRVGRKNKRKKKRHFSSSPIFFPHKTKDQIKPYPPYSHTPTVAIIAHGSC